MTNQPEYQPRENFVSTSHAFGVTDVGCVRDHNEDALRVDAKAGLYIVADGMGGHAAGEVASAIVLEMIPEFVRRGHSLAQALRETHRAIQRAAKEGHGVPGMGSTAVVLRMNGADYEIAWVGDSRAYLWDGTVLRQLSRDHSFVEKLIAAQAITVEEAERHPDRNVITQALGMAEYDQLRPDTVTGRMYRGEQILLCSDGLSSEVADGEIARVLASNGDNESRARALLEKARRAGGADNITVLLVRAPEDASRRPTTTAPFDTTRLTRALQKRSRWWLSGWQWEYASSAPPQRGGWYVRQRSTGSSRRGDTDKRRERNRSSGGGTAGGYRSGCAASGRRDKARIEKHPWTENKPPRITGQGHHRAACRWGGA